MNNINNNNNNLNSYNFIDNGQSSTGQGASSSSTSSVPLPQNNTPTTTPASLIERVKEYDRKHKAAQNFLSVIFPHLVLLYPKSDAALIIADIPGLGKLDEEHPHNQITGVTGNYHKILEYMKEIKLLKESLEAGFLNQTYMVCSGGGGDWPPRDPFKNLNKSDLKDLLKASTKPELPFNDLFKQMSLESSKFKCELPADFNAKPLSVKLKDIDIDLRVKPIDIDFKRLLESSSSIGEIQLTTEILDLQLEQRSITGTISTLAQRTYVHVTNVLSWFN